MESVLDEEWGAAKGYLRTGRRVRDWFYDAQRSGRELHRGALAARLPAGRHERDTRAAFGNLRVHRHRFAGGDQGRPGSGQTGHRASAPTARRRPLHDPLRPDGSIERGTNIIWPSAARSITNDKVLYDFTRNYFCALPLVIVLSGLLGWFLAGRALSPVNSVARSRAAHHAFQPRPADPAARRRRRTGPSDRSFQPHDDAAESILRADPPVFDRRLARAAHAAHRRPRAARSRAVHRADPGTISRGDGQRAGGRRAAFEHRARAAVALAGRIRASWPAKGPTSISPSWCADLVDQYQIPAEAEGRPL